MKKEKYMSELNKIKASDEFKNNTYNLMIKELERRENDTNHIKKENRAKGESNMRKNNRVMAAVLTVAACAMIAIGVGKMGAQPTQPTVPNDRQNVATEDRPAPMGKVAVNIEGVITEVSEDGKEFKLDNGQWVVVNSDTELGINSPTAAPKDEQLFEDKFEVGNSIAGFTLDDTSKDKVTAYSIYTNWNWDKER